MEASVEAPFESASQPYIGQWRRLVSTTNWEKGLIICQWRDELVRQGAPAAEYSDEAWARRVGGVSPQHVGRLRRVSRRFEGVRDQYEGLFWSHFHAALDWNDAEMWLEGAVQNTWSVSQMRRQRWEAIGAPDELKPSDEDIISGELNEDVDLSLESPTGKRAAGVLAEVKDPDAGAATEEGEAAAEVYGGEETDEDNDIAAYDQEPASQAPKQPRVRPFEKLPELPDDLAEAMEELKLAVLRHKLTDWAEVAAEDVLAWLDGIKALATAPSED